MSFEPLDESLEIYLRKLIELSENGALNRKVDDCPEFRKLAQLKFIEVKHEYIDGTRYIQLSYDALQYFEHKTKWKRERRVETAKNAIEEAAKVGGKFVGEAIKSMTRND